MHLVDASPPYRIQGVSDVAKKGGRRASTLLALSDSSCAGPKPRDVHLQDPRRRGFPRLVRGGQLGKISSAGDPSEHRKTRWAISQKSRKAGPRKVREEAKPPGVLGRGIFFFLGGGGGKEGFTEKEETSPGHKNTCDAVNKL